MDSKYSLIAKLAKITIWNWFRGLIAEENLIMRFNFFSMHITMQKQNKY